MTSPQIISPHAAQLGGGLTAHRTVPTRVRRTIGPWCFLDQLGPTRQGPPLAIGPHPHIGLQTFTWMIEGELLHRDSLGSEQILRPGQINLMTAGHGICHSEEAVPGQADGPLHSAQLWIALPEHARHQAPAFAHYPTLPLWQHAGWQLTLLAGAALGEESPAATHSPMVGLELLAQAGGPLTLPCEPGFEYGVLCLEGEAQVAGEPLAQHALAYLAPGAESLPLQAAAGTRLLLIGGPPWQEPLLVWWNFVARRPEEIAAAAADWAAGRRFGEVSHSPLPRLDVPPVPALRAP